MIPHVNDSKQIVDEEVPYDYEKAKEIKWYHQLLLNRPLKVVTVFLIAAVVAPILVYQFLFYNSLDLPPSDGYSFGSCLLPRASRIQCGIQTGNSADCHPQCCFDFGQNVCYHRFPSRFSYIMDREWAEEVTLHPRVASIPYNSQNSLTNIRISIDELTPTHMSLQFYNAREMSLQGKRIEIKNYTYHISSPELNIMVNGTQGNIFNTMRGPLIASNDIWEIAFRLTEESMYGLGDIPLKQDTVKIIYNHVGGLSSIPLIYAKSNGSYHGLLIDTKAPTEVTIQGDSQVVIRSITSQSLKFHIFIGPKPEDVMRNVIKLIGYNTEIEYWMLGAHVCNELSSTAKDAYDELNEFLDNNAKDSFLFESHCGTAPVVFDNQCRTDEDYVEPGEVLLRRYNKRFVPHVSPFIRKEKSNNTSEENDIEQTRNGNCSILPNFEEYMHRNADFTEIYTGLIGDKDVIYPDYENASVEFIKTLWKYKTKLDGVVLENSWPLDEVYKIHNETYSYLPYFNKNFEDAFNHTPQWNITRPNKEKYLYSHNEYGNHFANAFKKISDENIPLWSTSQWMNGKVLINKQNINASWANLQKELTEAALGGTSGHWLWSSPICGDTEHFDPDTQTSLCAKWYMAATYFPLIKIHSKSVPRHPLAFVGTNKMYMTTALSRRISLLPYIFTTLQEGPLLRPMFYQFPSSDGLKDLKSQFSVGDDLLIVPNLQPSQSHVHVWMPPGSWYELWSGLKLDGEEGEAVTLATTEADFLTLIRGGSILITQKDVKETAEITRLRSDLSLTIALFCETVNNTDQTSSANTTECRAGGKLYITKDLSLTFRANSTQLFIEAKGKGFIALCDEKEASWANKIKELIVYGLEEEYNNYDHHRQQTVSIDLCQLESEKEIVYSFV